MAYDYDGQKQAVPDHNYDSDTAEDKPHGDGSGRPDERWLAVLAFIFILAWGFVLFWISLDTATFRP